MENYMGLIITSVIWTLAGLGIYKLCRFIGKLIRGEKYGKL